MKAACLPSLLQSITRRKAPFFFFFPQQLECWCVLISDIIKHYGHTSPLLWPPGSCGRGKASSVWYIRRKRLLGNMDFLWSGTSPSFMGAVVRFVNWMLEHFHSLLTGKYMFLNDLLAQNLNRCLISIQAQK